MQPFAQSLTPEIAFAAGALKELGARATALAGGKASVLIVADPVLTKLGQTARAIAILEEQGHKAVVYDGFKGEPKASDVDAATAIGRAAQAQIVVGFGGGSSLDTSKLVASTIVSGLAAESYALCATPLPRQPLPIIAVPTTAGTGSEVTRTVIFATASGAKVWAWGDELKPRLALLDPELTTGIPGPITAATGLDALVHAMEASTSTRRTDAIDMFCHRAISLISQSLVKAVTEPGNIEARGKMLLGSAYAGMGIDNCGTALAHNISHAMGSLAPIMHGRATGIAMYATIEWAAEGNREAFAKVADAMGAKSAITAFRDLTRATGMKLSLEGDGLDLSRPELLAEKMAAPENAPMRSGTARTVADADLLTLAKVTYAAA
jgi:alcohol dehydrogenase